MSRRSMRSSTATVVGLSLLASLAVLLPAAPSVQAAQPKPNQTGLVPETPRTNVPRITTGEITDLAYIGDRVFIAGTFTSIRNNTSTNTTTVAQRYLASYNMTTGLIDTGFRPTFDSSVEEIEASPDGTKLFIVGRFNTVNGVTKRKIASINPTTGATVAGFTANANSAGTSVEATNTTVYVGGQFSTVNGTARTGLVALNATTGAVVTAFNNNLSGGIGTNGLLTVQAMVLSHDDSKLLVVHTGRQVAGQDRYGAALISTTTNQLLPWRTRLWDENLQFVGGIQRAYAADIAPNDQYFVVTSGSGGDRPPISDTAVAFPLNGNDNVEPLWVSRLFDSVYSVAISEVAVYLGGHFNYMESPTAPDPWPGLDNVGYGKGQGLAGYGLGDDIVTREHIGAVSPATGKALEWSPESNSFEGNKAMLLTPRGLFAGGDATTQGGTNVGRVAFYDLNSVAAPGPNETTIINPIMGRVEEADVPFVIDGTATATSGINRVQVEVRDRDNGQYLQDDLVTWGASNTINATLGAGTTNRTWSLPLTISGNHRFQVLARTYATNGTNDATKATKYFETFGLADQTPTTSINGPQGGIIPTTTFILTGTAQDDVGVNSIIFAIRDAQNRYLQNDGTADLGYNSFRGVPDVVGATAATWSYEVTVPYESEWTIQATAVDTAGQSDLRSATSTWLVSATAVAPSVAITTPAIMNPPTAAATLTLAPGAPLTFTGSATDDEGLDYVEISLRNSTTRENLGAGGNWGTNVTADWFRVSPGTSINGSSYNWTYTTSNLGTPFNLRPGTYSFAVRAVDDLGLTTSSANQGRLTINVQVPGDAFPDAKLNVTGTVTGLQTLHLDLAGTATDDHGVTSVGVAIQDRDSSRYLQPNGTLAAAFVMLPANLATPNGASTTWTLPVDLPQQGDYSVTAYAFDTVDQQDPSTTGATARYPIYPGDQPPVQNPANFAPTEGTVFTGSKILVSGRFEDDQQMAAVQVAIIDGANRYMSSSGTFTSTTPSWRTAYLNSVGSPGSNFSYTTPAIPSGAYTVLARGVDQHDFVTLVPTERHVTVTAPPNNAAPVANFTFVCTANVCAFDGRSSTDENAPTLTYAWTFGQGTASGSGPVPSRTYTAAGTYTVTLTVKDEYGLTGSLSKVLPAITEPAGNAAPLPVINAPSCVQLVCNISGVGTADPNTGDTFTYLWDFGDLTPTSTSSAPSHSFPAAGTYTVSLTATDGWLKAATVTRQVTVSGVVVPPDNVAPVANFAVPTCNLLSCDFTSSSTDSDGTIQNIAWNFGDGQTGTGSPINHVFTAGTYAVLLTVTDDDGATGTFSRTVTVSGSVNTPPVANFTPPATCDISAACQFTSTSTDTAPGTVVGYAWNFGDGFTATVAAPTHKYVNPGTFNVTLTVTDNQGATNAITKAVTVTGPANVLPVANFVAPTCNGLTCSFNGGTSTDSDGSIVTYAWNFSDLPTATGQATSHTFSGPGTFNVTLTVTDNRGGINAFTLAVTVASSSNIPPVANFPAPVCTALSCVFNGSSSSDADGTIAGYSWNFNNGSPATGANPTKVFSAAGTYSVVLTVTDNLGATGTFSRSVTVSAANVVPNAAFTSSCTQLVCTFDASTSTDSDGTIASYSWNFNNPPTATGVAPSHTFTAAGTYSVVLTVTDNLGATDTQTNSVTVSSSAATVAFRAQATAQGSGVSASVAIPAAVQAGDVLVLFVTANVATTASTPSGWTLLGTQSDGSPDMRTWVFARVAAAGGGSVSSTLGDSAAKSTRNLVAYSGASMPTVIASSVIGTTSASLTAPAVAAPAGSMVVRQWSNKTSAATGWTLGGGITSRGAAIGTGSGRIVAIAGDSASGAAATATSDASGAKGIAFSVVVPPA